MYVPFISCDSMPLLLLSLLLYEHYRCEVVVRLRDGVVNGLGCNAGLMRCERLRLRWRSDVLPRYARLFHDQSDDQSMHDRERIHVG